MFSSSKFEEENNYQGNDLGAVWTKVATSFRVWAPTASQVVLNLYRSGSQEDQLYRVPMKKEGKGTWAVHVPGDLNGPIPQRRGHNPVGGVLRIGIASVAP